MDAINVMFICNLKWVTLGFISIFCTITGIRPAKIMYIRSVTAPSSGYLRP